MVGARLSGAPLGDKIKDAVAPLKDQAVAPDAAASKGSRPWFKAGSSRPTVHGN